MISLRARLTVLRATLGGACPTAYPVPVSGVHACLCQFHAYLSQVHSCLY
jgi:hypothetical protein